MKPHAPKIPEAVLRTMLNTPPAPRIAEPKQSERKPSKRS
jgi:hypothetical protein